MNTHSTHTSSNKQSVIVWMAACFLFVTGSVLFSTAMASQAFFKQGVVAARSLVLGPDGQPIFAEFGKDGEVVNVIGEATGELLDATVMFGDAYRLQAKSFNDFKKANEKGSARGAKILTREEYETTEFGSVDVPTNRKDAQGNFIPESKPIRKPSLRQDTLSVYVRDKKTILFPEDGPILLESRIDLRNLKDLGPIVLEDKRGGDYVLSVLLNSEGRVLETSTVNIGYRSAFFSSENRATALSDTDKDRQVSREKDDIVLGPLAGVHVYSSLVRRQVGIADEEGQYSLSYLSPPCPGFTFEYRHNLIAEIPYKSFNPKSSQPWRKYSANLEVFDICNGLGQGAPATTLAGLSAQQSSAAIVATQAVPLLNADIKVDVILLTGEGLLSNSADESDVVPLGDSTQYNVDLPDFDLINPAELDLNGDRQPDRLKKLSENTIGVFFPDNTPGPGGQETPDLVRRTDIEPDLQDQSLLETLNIDDLEDTDLYVYRLSNDQLITQREGLKQEEYVPYNNIGVSDDENKFFYKLLIRGTRQRGFITGQLEDFQEKTQINEKLIGRDVDFLRVGEQVKIIAINRITGYIGTTVTQVEGSANGNLNFPIKKLVLRPPNLKIKAERTYTVEAGLTKDEERKYLIGAEGSALTSDTTVVISSQWFDQDGSPLPSNLPGYTGRLAKVVGANSLQAVGGDVAMFDILPGNKLQLVRLSEGDIGREHFYVQVSGEPMDGNPDFSTLGAGAGPQLEYRPQHYVPIKVALLDEVQTRKRRNELFYAQQDALTELEKVDAVYKWVYRPEMQFSVFDLNVRKITTTAKDDKGNEIIRTVYEQGKRSDCAGFDSLLECLITGAISADIFYDLDAPSNDALEPFGPQRQLLWALGGEEEGVSFGAGKKETFTDIASLSKLGSDELLALNLYQNSDVENVLWEFALVKASMLVDTNRDGFITSEGPDEETVAVNETSMGSQFARLMGINVAQAVTHNPRVQLNRRDSTSSNDPFIFWLNDDFDTVVNNDALVPDAVSCDDASVAGSETCQELDINNYPDDPAITDFSLDKNNDEAHRSTIETLSDLEDFVAMQVKIKPYVDKKTIVKLTAKGVSVNIFQGVWDEENSLQHVKDITTAKKQTVLKDLVAVEQGSASKNLYLESGSTITLSPAMFPEDENDKNNSERVGRFIFEGVDSPDTCRTDKENCYLELVIFEEDEEVGRTKLYLRFEKVEELYEHYTAGDNTATQLTSLNKIGPKNNNQEIPKGFWREEAKDQYILFVHGWRQQPWERRRFAESAMKRLYWQGYKGRFGLFSWPTDWFYLSSSTTPAQVFRFLSNSQNYDRSEAIARRSSLRLFELLTELHEKYPFKLNVFAHSMGNVVVSESLKIASISSGIVVNNYVASQAATVASAYDARVAKRDTALLFRNAVTKDQNEDLDIPVPDKYTYNTPSSSRSLDPYDLESFDAYKNTNSARPYYSKIKGSGASRIILFNNFNDRALSGWSINQNLKPSFGYSYSATHKGVPEFVNNIVANGITIEDEFCDGIFFCSELLYSDFDDRAVIMARIIPAKSKALGATRDVGKEVDDELPLDDTFGYKDGPFDHSAQFLGSNMKRQEYWEALSEDFRL